MNVTDATFEKGGVGLIADDPDGVEFVDFEAYGDHEPEAVPEPGALAGGLVVVIAALVCVRSPRYRRRG